MLSMYQWIHHFIVSDYWENCTLPKLLICKTSFPYCTQQVVQVRTSKTTRRDGARALLSLLSIPVSCQEEQVMCALKAFTDYFGSYWVGYLFCSKAMLKWSLPSWAAKKTLVSTSPSRNLTSSAVVSKVQSDPELWCFNYSLSYLISLFSLSKCVPKLIQSIVTKVRDTGSKNLIQGNK